VPPIFVKINTVLTCHIQLIFYFNCILTTLSYMLFGVKPMLLLSSTKVTLLWLAITDQNLSLAHCVQLMEYIIKNQLLSQLLTMGLINKQQHGFISKHSTVTNLLESTHDWSLLFHGKQPVDGDFSKSFDGVVHSELIHKLRVATVFFKRIEAFLYCGSQCVVVKNHYSSWSKVITDLF